MAGKTEAMPTIKPRVLAVETVRGRPVGQAGLLEAGEIARDRGADHGRISGATDYPDCGAMAKQWQAGKSPRGSVLYLFRGGSAAETSRAGEAERHPHP
jgi:hypothetical protein